MTPYFKEQLASKVAARKWAELQDEGARMQSIAHKASTMIGHDAETILRVVNEELAETEGGSTD